MQVYNLYLKWIALDIDQIYKSQICENDSKFW